MNETEEEVERDIRWVRETYGWNYKDIAQALGVTVWQVYKVLRREQAQRVA